MFLENQGFFVRLFFLVRRYKLMLKTCRCLTDQKFVCVLIDHNGTWRRVELKS